MRGWGRETLISVDFWDSWGWGEGGYGQFPVLRPSGSGCCPNCSPQIQMVHHGLHSPGIFFVPNTKHGTCIVCFGPPASEVATLTFYTWETEAEGDALAQDNHGIVVQRPDSKWPLCHSPVMWFWVKDSPSSAVNGNENNSPDVDQVPNTQICSSSSQWVRAFSSNPHPYPILMVLLTHRAIWERPGERENPKPYICHLSAREDMCHIPYPCTTTFCMDFPTIPLAQCSARSWTSKNMAQRNTQPYYSLSGEKLFLWKLPLL